MLVKIINEGRKKVTKNDKGEIVPEKCPKCGSEIGLYIQGEPIYRCSNDKCKKYFGTMPCHLNENIKSELIKARKEINTNPTEKQKEAGNYKMGHINIMGFEITLENPKGSYRKGKDRNGKEWKTLMHYDYGYFTKTLGYDGDAVDVFIGNNLKSDKIFAIDQFINGKFDETKFMLGFNNKTQAKQAYLSNYEKNWKGFKEITEITVDDFKKWLYNGKQQRKPFYQYKTLKNVFITEAQRQFIEKRLINEGASAKLYHYINIDNFNAFNYQKDTLKENQQLELNAYHGTCHDFNDFERGHEGTGEGSKLYGTGIYVSTLYQVGRHYAGYACDRNKKLHYKYIGNGINGVSDANIKNAEEEMSKYGGYQETVMHFKLAPNDTTKYGGLIKYILQNSTKEDWKSQQIVYKVEIPEDNGQNYLDFERGDTGTLLNKLFINDYENALVKFYLEQFKENPTVFDEKFFALATPEQRAKMFAKDEVYKMNKGGNIIDTYFYYCYHLGDDFVQQKLMEHGFIGIKAFTGSYSGYHIGKGFNYIIWDPSNIRIINKEYINEDKTLKNVFITEKQMNYIKMVLNESINYEKYAKESLKQSIENRDGYENNPDSIRFFNKEYSYYGDSYDDENIIAIIPFILADYPLIGKTFKFGEPGTAHNSIRLQLKKIYEKMPLEILVDAFKIRGALTKNEVLSKIVYNMITYENDGRLYIIKNPWKENEKICIFTFWTEDMTISINDFVEYVISKKPEIKECDLILIANNENPYIIYDNKNKISLDNNHEQQILHNLPAKEKWEQMQDFRDERDKIIGNKLAKRDINGNKTGKEMTQAEYNNLKYGYVAENKKAQN